jgi:hypothetical protein
MRKKNVSFFSYLTRAPLIKFNDRIKNGFFSSSSFSSESTDENENPI